MFNNLPSFLVVGYGISYPIAFLGKALGNVNLTLIDGKAIFNGGKYLIENQTEIMVAAAE